MAQGGEFAFVLYAAAAGAGIIDAEQNAILTGIVILSMVLTPLLIAAMNSVVRRLPPSEPDREHPDGLTGAALIIGFGRVGQIASQFLFARGYEVSIIDMDVEMIDIAREQGFEVYYGDGTRLDILHAAGAAEARVIVVCVDKPESGTRITELAKSAFPQVPVLARAIDRRHSIALVHAGADLEVKETFESALVLGASALERLGASQASIVEIGARIRANDRRRFQLELAGGIEAGRALFNRNTNQSESSASGDPP
jgi:glutathione-regulated potassium-efflux system protein KefB